MKRNRRSYFNLGWLALAFSVWSSASVLADTIGPGSRVFVEIENTAGVPDSLLARAEKEAEKTYREVGIQLVWIPAGSRRDEGLRLRILLAPEDKAAFFLDNGERAGRAIGTDGQGARRAYVFPERVKKLVIPGVGASESRVLGAVIAHEIGHLLLPPNAHSAQGIMRATFHVRDFDRPEFGGIRFTPEQAAQIRATLHASDSF